MTWDARPAKRGDLHRILCGRMVAGEYTCRELVAHKALWSSDEQGPPERDAVWLPVGLTDDGTPGEFRWSRDSARRHRNHQTRLRRRGGDTRAVRLAGRSITVPCLVGHENRIDGTHLSP